MNLLHRTIDGILIAVDSKNSAITGMVFKLKQFLQNPGLSISQLLSFLLLALQTSFVQAGILDIMTQAAKQHPGKSAVYVWRKEKSPF